MVQRSSMGGFRLGNRRWYPWLFVLLCFGFLVVAYEVGGKDLKIEWAVSVLAGVGGLTTFLYTQHLQETRLFTELFKDFNQRYNSLNARLNTIAETAEAGIQTQDAAGLSGLFLSVRRGVSLLQRRLHRWDSMEFVDARNEVLRQCARDS
jgi:hypothetical protein